MRHHSTFLIVKVGRPNRYHILQLCMIVRLSSIGNQLRRYLVGIGWSCRVFCFRSCRGLVRDLLDMGRYGGFVGAFFGSGFLGLRSKTKNIRNLLFRLILLLRWINCFCSFVKLRYFLIVIYDTKDKGTRN